MNVSLPTAPDAIDPAWLGERLGGRVHGYRVEPLTDRRGVNGETFRLRLDSDAEGVPPSVVAKFPNAASRSVAGFQRWYEREVRFYRELAAETPLRTPRCYSAEIAPNDDFILLMEDLSALQQGNQVAGCSAETARTVIEAVAGLHARWWERAPQPHAWLPYTTVGVDHASGVGASFARSWSRVRDLVPSAAHPVLDAGVEEYPRLLEEMATAPVTVCHGDFRLDNLFFEGSEPSAPPIAFDWQFACRARGTYDVAYFLALDLEPDVLAVERDGLLAGYRVALAGRGIEGYDEAACHRDYAVSLVLATAVFAIGAGVPQPSEASRVMHEVGLARLGEAIAHAAADGWYE